MSKRLLSFLVLAIVLGASLIAGSSMLGAEAAMNALAPPPSSQAPLLMSFKDGGTIGANGLAVNDEDIVSFDGSGFQMYFDGSDLGLSALEIDAINISSDTEILMSFSQDTSLPGVGTVEDTDVVRFTATSLGENTAGSFEMYFHGRSVNLTSNDEDVNGLEVLPDGRLLISTLGNFSLPTLTGGGEDLLVFTPTSLGATTAGSWAMHLNGSDIDYSPTGRRW